MLRCLAGICGSREPQVWAPPRPKVRKPMAAALTEMESANSSVEQTLARHELIRAPPNFEPSLAYVSSDYQKNPDRLLVFLPAPGAPFGSWDAGPGVLSQLLLWADANEYAVAILSAEEMEKDPVNTWDGVMRGNHAKTVTVLVLQGGMGSLHAALLGLDPILYSRLRTVMEVWEQVLPETSPAPRLPLELRKKMQTALVSAPPTWAALQPYALCQCFFELLLEREDHFSKAEYQKFSGLSAMKENDLPGVRRVGVDDRVQRISRNRDKDELAKVLTKNEEIHRTGGDEDGEEPGVD